jgi:hypothetical protein
MGYPNLSLITYNNNDKITAFRKAACRVELLLCLQKIASTLALLLTIKSTGPRLFLVAHFTQCAFRRTTFKN